MYKHLVRPLLYKLPPENAHYFSAGLLQLSFQIPILNQLLRSYFKESSKSLEKNVFGLSFPNPVGIAAGFDKDARWIDALEMLGFGFIEVGTITPKEQRGNEKPRLFRLQEDEALINRMGFNNSGADAVLKNIQKSNHKNPLGGNIGKNKITPNEEAPADYLKSFEVLYDSVDYFTVNVSSPNTPGLRALQGKDELQKIFHKLFEFRESKSKRKPVLLKIAPDLNEPQLEEIVNLVMEMKIDGVIATNTTLNREELKSSEALCSESGGLSGKPVRERSTEVIRFLHQASGGRIPIVGVGGIHSPKDAIEKLEAGASLIQLYTGFIYEGPNLIKHINKELSKKWA
jgi:dihydroorotate dehydrogenase